MGERRLGINKEDVNSVKESITSKDGLDAKWIPMEAEKLIKVETADGQFFFLEIESTVRTPKQTTTALLGEGKWAETKDAFYAAAEEAGMTIPERLKGSKELNLILQKELLNGWRPGENLSQSALSEVSLINRFKYKFQKNGYTYEAEVTIGSDGAKDIAHFVSIDGTRQSIGYSAISESGELSNAFEVPDALQGQDLSKAMYERLGQEGFSTVNSSYNSSSLPVNYNEFMKLYDPSLNNAVDAVMSTPAAKALGSGWTPTKITVTPGKSVTVLWVKK